MKAFFSTNASLFFMISLRIIWLFARLQWRDPWLAGCTRGGLLPCEWTGASASCEVSQMCDELSNPRAAQLCACVDLYVRPRWHSHFIQTDAGASFLDSSSPRAPPSPLDRCIWLTGTISSSQLVIRIEKREERREKRREKRRENRSGLSCKSQL
jgi:hypothetical protein